MKQVTIEFPRVALSLIQPFAWALFHAGKNIENRVWWTHYRGPVWIAASAQVTRAYYAEAAAFITRVSGLTVPPRDDLPRGVMLGRVNFDAPILPGGYKVASDFFPGTAREEFLLNGSEWGRRHGLRHHPNFKNPWYIEHQFGYAVSDQRALATPIPCKGHQRLWYPKGALLEQLWAAYHA